jgi:hypothetical protein
MNEMIRLGLEVPLHYLFYIKDYESYDGLDDHGFDYLMKKYGRHMMQSVRASVAWAAKNPDYDYRALVGRYPYENDEIYFFMRRFHETLEEKIVERGHRFEVQFDEPVTYLSPVQQAALRADVVDGLLVGMNGPVDTTQSYRLFQGRGRGGPYVMRSDGEVIVTSHGVGGVWYHSSLAGGEAVVCAGFMNVSAGKILTIDRCSGHYETSTDMLRNVLTELSDKGVDTNAIEVFGL